MAEPEKDTVDGSPERAAPHKRPHALRRLYDWVLHWAQTPYATPALALLAFTESSFFPIPPDALLIPLALGNRRRAYRYATICSAASILGGVLGFVIGFFLMKYVGNPIIDFYHARKWFEEMVALMEPGMNLWVFVAAFSPIPYKVFTIAAGVVAEGMPGGHWHFFWGFVLASALGRSGRFFLVAALLHRWGETIKRFIDRYFEWCALAFGLLLVGAVILLKYVF